MAQRAADQITLTDLTDGVSVVMSSESYVFPGTTSAAIAGSTTTKIQAIQGDQYVAASVNVANVTKPAGITVTSDNHATAPTLTIAIASSVTTAGEVVIPVVVDGLTIEKRFSYSLALKGSTGSAGKGISSTAISYQKSSSGTDIPTGSWSGTVPSVGAGEYLWTRTVITYTDGASDTSYSVARTGTNGSNGTNATYNGLKNEAQMIVTNPAGAALGAQTIQVDFFGFVGNTRTATTATVGTLPSGMTVGTNTPGTTGADGVLTLVVANNATLGGADFGVVPITLTTGGQARVQNFSWAKAKAGTDGSNGNDAVTVEVSSSQGLVFKNTQIATILTARVYKGGAEVTGAALTALGTIKWYKDGGTTAVGTGTSLTVSAGDVADRATYEAKLEY